MPVQTANTLFRFTGEFKYLLHTLSKGFSPRLSLEVDSIGEKCYYPMVCFCDIPLSLVNNHMELYGKYGIGMTKAWGVSKGINPVLYYNKDSILYKNLFNLINEGVSKTQELFRLAVNGEWTPTSYGKSLTVDHKAEGYQERREAFWNCVHNLLSIKSTAEQYFKPRTGEYSINGNHYPDYHFYDEREWRYLELGVDFGLTTPDRMAEAVNTISLEEKERLNLKIEAAGKYTLAFSASDIRYIIVQHESEIIPIVNHLKSLQNQTGDGLLYTQDEIILLTSRILTNEQIREDF